MFSDPLAVTYDGSAKSLPRIGSSPYGAAYKTADGEFEVKTSKVVGPRDGSTTMGITMSRRLPDPTSGDVFDAYRDIRNSFTLSYSFDLTRAEASVDIPKLRTALLALVDSTFQSRLISGEL